MGRIRNFIEKQLAARQDQKQAVENWGSLVNKVALRDSLLACAQDGLLETQNYSHPTHTQRHAQVQWQQGSNVVVAAFDAHSSMGAGYYQVKTPQMQLISEGTVTGTADIAVTNKGVVLVNATGALSNASVAQLAAQELMDRALAGRQAIEKREHDHQIFTGQVTQEAAEHAQRELSLQDLSSAPDASAQPARAQDDLSLE